MMGVGLSGFSQRLAAQDRIHRAAEQIGDCYQIFRVGYAVAPLPLGHGRRGTAQCGAQIPLGHVSRQPELNQRVHPGMPEIDGHFHTFLPGFACLITVIVLEWEKVLGWLRGSYHLINEEFQRSTSL